MSNSSSDGPTFQHDLLSDDALTEWTARLSSDEAGSECEQLSRAILVDFVLRAAFNREQSQVTIQWLASVFDKILDYDDPRTALRLPKRDNHRPAGAGEEKGSDVAIWISEAMLRGYTEPEAKKLAAATFYLDERSVRRCWTEYSSWVAGKESGADWDEYFRLFRRPLPASKRGQ